MLVSDLGLSKAPFCESTIASTPLSDVALHVTYSRARSTARLFKPPNGIALQQTPKS